MRTGSSLRPALKAVLKVYDDLDKQIAVLNRVTGLQCPEGCGLCCKNTQVEATVPEVLPLAFEIYLDAREGKVLESIQGKKERGDDTCVLYEPDAVIEGNGRCTSYSTRPLLCRLFGFASRKNKYGRMEFSPCRVIRHVQPDILQRVEIAIQNGISPPVYQESFLRVAGILPSLGFRRLPINQAILEALGYLQWKKPRPRRYRKAA